MSRDLLRFPREGGGKEERREENTSTQVLELRRGHLQGVRLVQWAQVVDPEIRLTRSSVIQRWFSSCRIIAKHR